MSSVCRRLAVTAGPQRRQPPWADICAARRPYAATPITPPPKDARAITESQARDRAQRLLDLLPGDNNYKKTAYFTGTVGLFTFLEAKELYIINNETTCMLAFIALMRLFYVYLGPSVSEFCAKGIAEYRQVWTAKFEAHKQVFRDQFSTLDKFNDIKAAVAEYIRIKRENIALEDELHQAHQVNKHLLAIKAQLDERVRRVFEKRESEKRALLAAVKERVLQDLRDPKMHDAIMRQCLVDIESIGVSKAK